MVRTQEIPHMVTVNFLPTQRKTNLLSNYVRYDVLMEVAINITGL
jgi:hypothetical protein